MSSLDETFQKLKNAVLDKKPVLKEILAQRGSKNLYEYAKDYIDVNLVPPIHEREDELLSTFEREVGKRLGTQIAKEATDQLRKYYYVSTADHHGPLCHPFFLNSNLIASAPLFEKQDPVLKNVIVLACANISFDNSSFPRGLFFNSYANGMVERHELPFFPRSVRPRPVYKYGPYGTDGIDKIKKILIEKAKEGHITQKQSENIAVLLDEIYAKPDVLNSSTFSDQVTKTNFELWQKFFNPGKNPQHSHIDPPNLIYLEQETFVNQLLMDHHLDSDTTINHILFDKAYNPLMEQYFDGVTGGFSLEKKIGTYLFWGLPGNSKYRLQMVKEGNSLVSVDGSYRVELTPDSLHEKLTKQELIPSTLLSFIVLAFYYGLKLLGGFSQVNYLTFMKNAYIKMQTDRGNYRSIEVCAHSQTKELCGDVTLAFLGVPDGSLTPATGLDLILYGTENTWPQFVDLARHITLEEALNPMMPELHRITYPEGSSERDDSLLQITAQDIANLTNLDKKIKPCAYF